MGRGSGIVFLPEDCKVVSSNPTTAQIEDEILQKDAKKGPRF